MLYIHHDTPVGTLLLAGDGRALTEVHFANEGRRVEPEPGWQRDATPFREVCRQLDEYFAGARKVFALRLAPSGTPFQLAVLQELQRIPYGETRSYSEVARAIGRPSAQRAVGAANGRNPIPIIIPCHRVIGQSGKLVGFGGGLPVKRYLLDLEARGQGALNLTQAG